MSARALSSEIEMRASRHSLHDRESIARLMTPMCQPRGAASTRTASRPGAEPGAMARRRKGDSKTDPHPAIRSSFMPAYLLKSAGFVSHAKVVEIPAVTLSSISSSRSDCASNPERSAKRRARSTHRPVVCHAMIARRVRSPARTRTIDSRNAPALRRVARSFRDSSTAGVPKRASAGFIRRCSMQLIMREVRRVSGLHRGDEEERPIQPQRARTAELEDDVVR